MHSSQPLVSVVIPCYNHERFVQDSIQSIIDQTYKNIELIIIDDGSKDNSIAKIQEMVRLCERRFVRFEFRSRANIGLSETLNEALEWCEGKYFSPIASDDQMLEDKTAIQVDFLQNHNDIVAVCGGVKLINKNNEEVGERLNKPELYDFKKIIMHEHDLPAATQLIRLDAIRKVGGYNVNLFIEDWYMLLKLAEHNSIFYMSQFFAIYRLHDNNISKNTIVMHNSRFDVLNCFKNSIYYDKAVSNIKWLNACDIFTENKEKKTINFLNLLIINPSKTANLVSKKLKKAIKNIKI